LQSNFAVWREAVRRSYQVYDAKRRDKASSKIWRNPSGTGFAGELLRCAPRLRMSNTTFVARLAFHPQNQRAAMRD